MRLTLEIVGKTLFDAEVGGDAPEVGEARSREVMHTTMPASCALDPAPAASVPTRREPRAERQAKRLDEIIYAHHPRAAGARRGTRGDFLSMLLSPPATRTAAR